MCCDRRSDNFFTGVAVGMVAGAAMYCMAEKCCKCSHGRGRKSNKSKLVKKAENCAEAVGDHIGL